MCAMLNPDPPVSARGENRPCPPAQPAEDARPARAQPTDHASDRALHAALARFTGGISPAGLADAFLDCAMHLALSPAKQAELAAKAAAGAVHNINFAWTCARGSSADPCGCALPNDNRFRAPEWQAFPFNLYAHTFLSVERWWEAATTGVRGASRRHQEVTTFAVRQLLDTVAPSNFVATNPTVQQRTQAERGMNLVRGASNWLDDLARLRTGAAPAGMDAFRVGDTVAASPGKVVHRTRLAEIIQYAPTTDRVRPEPIVVVPAWIMKYYILDLSRRNSLVRFLTEQGFTVFMISWKNPGSEDREFGFDDYRTEGFLAALEAATAITGARKVHAVGYCLGGTLLAMAAAAMAREHDDRLATVSLLAAQTDFTEAGELMLFINESQISFLEDLMWPRGYLAADQMAGAFELLRSNDLVWSRVVHEYLMGARSAPNDIIAWNADKTRMPYRMHSQYLRSLFLHNDLAEGRFRVNGRPVTIQDIRVPMLAVGTENDHVSPWRSVFKLHLLADTDVTFILTNGGHNAGILSEPGHARRHFRMATQRQQAHYVDPDAWLADNAAREGSWWPAWTDWLTERSGALGAVPLLGQSGGAFAPLGEAPGEYVFMK